MVALLILWSMCAFSGINNVFVETNSQNMRQLNGNSSHSWCHIKNVVSDDNKLHFSPLKHGDYERVESGGGSTWNTWRETLKFCCAFPLSITKILVFISLLQWTQKKKYLNRKKKNCQWGKFSKFLDFMFPKAERSETDRMPQDFWDCSHCSQILWDCSLLLP